jgi:hypothetical protein
VDLYEKSVPSDKKGYDKDYPYQAVQVSPNKFYPPPPFNINKEFRYAFNEAVKAYDVDNFKKMIKPSNKFVNLIKENYKR